MSDQLREALKEGLLLGGVECEACGETVDLESVESLDRAGYRWNRHVGECEEIDIVAQDYENGEWITHDP